MPSYFLIRFFYRRKFEQPLLSNIPTKTIFKKITEDHRDSSANETFLSEKMLALLVNRIST